MKKIFFVIALILNLTLMSAFDNPTSNLNNDDSEDIIRRSLPDSLYRLLKNKPVIFYSYGHYGYSWSLIAKMDSGYRAFSGRVGYGGDYHYNIPTESNQFDTTRLFSQNESLFSWGLDTIAAKVKNMKIINRDYYITVYTNLSVINSEGVNIFNSNDAMTYSGPDSICFNKKYQKLCLIMRWLSDTKIRQYLPDSIIY